MLNPLLVEQVLEKLGLAATPETSLEGLTSVYQAWCRNIPFDNVQKVIFYSGDARGPVPGHNSQDFFTRYLAHGTGGTCWANSHALHDLLTELGFRVVRGAGTMLVTPDRTGPTHGTVIATVQGLQYLVDGSMQTERPVLMQEGIYEHQGHPASRIGLERREDQWFVLWYPPHQLDGLWCRIEELDVPAARFNEYHERTRTHSPFNNALYVRRNKPGGTTSIAFDKLVRVESGGSSTSETISQLQRDQILVEEFNLSEEIVSSLPLADTDH